MTCLHLGGNNVTFTDVVGARLNFAVFYFGFLMFSVVRNHNSILVGKSADDLEEVSGEAYVLSKSIGNMCKSEPCNQNPKSRNPCHRP